MTERVSLPAGANSTLTVSGPVIPSIWVKWTGRATPHTSRGCPATAVVTGRYSGSRQAS